MEKTTIAKCAFVLAGARASVEFARYDDRYSFDGSFDGGGGQIDGRLREAASQVETAERVVQLCDLWDALHLKPLDTPAAAYGVDGATAIMAELDGTRIGVSEAAADAQECGELEDAEFSNSSDVIDSRDIIARIEALTDYLADLDGDPTPDTYDPDADPRGDRSDAVSELAKLKALEEVCNGTDWEYGTTLIHDYYFEEYARDLAEDLYGDKIRDAEWPMNHIDWEAAADSLKQDFSQVEFDGVTYWVR